MGFNNGEIFWSVCSQAPLQVRQKLLKRSKKSLSGCKIKKKGDAEGINTKSHPNSIKLCPGLFLSPWHSSPWH